jgi:hypothetical protein
MVDCDEPYARTGAQVAIRTVPLEICPDNLAVLAAGPRVGVRLYADALRLSLPTSSYREFWRVLESAFGKKDKALVQSLAERIILTKKTWGAPSGGVSAEAPPLMSYVSQGGGIVLIRKPKK